MIDDARCVGGSLLPMFAVFLGGRSIVRSGQVPTACHASGSHETGDRSHAGRYRVLLATDVTGGS